MSERGLELQTVVDEQLAELRGVVAALDRDTLRRACPGREKLGDGTVGASAWHTADNYRRIAEFVTIAVPDRLAAPGAGPHRAPRLLRSLGHRPPDHTRQGAGHGHDDGQYTADNLDVPAVADQLKATVERLRRVAQLTDDQLDVVPPKGSFRFCDGERTLEQVLASLLRHQRHQLDALQQAIA